VWYRSRVWNGNYGCKDEWCYQVKQLSCFFFKCVCSLKRLFLYFHVTFHFKRVMTISQLVLEVEIYKSIKRESTFESFKEKSWMSELTIINQQSLKGSVVNQTSLNRESFIQYPYYMYEIELFSPNQKFIEAINKILIGWE